MDDTFDENCNFKFDSSPSNRKTGGKTKKQNMKKSQTRKTKQQRGGEIKNYAYTLFAMGVVFLFIGATSFPPLLFLAFIYFILFFNVRKQPIFLFFLRYTVAQFTERTNSS